MADEAAVERAGARDRRPRCGRLDILVNNAGHEHPQAAARADPRRVAPGHRHQPHQRVPLLERAAYPIMKTSGGGKIINIGSMMSIFGTSFAPAYAARKGGIVQLTKATGVGVGPGQHPGERGAARLDRHRADHKARAGGPGPPRARARAHARRALGRARRSRGRRGVSRRPRLRFRHRHRHSRSTEAIRSRAEVRYTARSCDVGVGATLPPGLVVVSGCASVAPDRRGDAPAGPARHAALRGGHLRVRQREPQQEPRQARPLRQLLLRHGSGR